MCGLTDIPIIDYSSSKNIEDSKILIQKLSEFPEVIKRVHSSLEPQILASSTLGYQVQTY